MGAYISSSKRGEEETERWTEQVWVKIEQQKLTKSGKEKYSKRLQ